MIGFIFDCAFTPPPSGYLECGGQAVSRTKYADLFRHIGTTFGNGDGTTTFNLPDLRGRVSAGFNSLGGTTEARLSGGIGGVNATSIGAFGGLQSVILTGEEVPGLTTIGDVVGSSSGSLANGEYEGEPESHNNVQPTLVLSKVIFTNVFD